MARRRYSDSDRATALAALDANGGDASKTARDTGVPRQTIEEWRDGRVSDDVPELRQRKRGELADKLEAVAHALVDAMPDKIGDASLAQTATALGISLDKMRLLREQATSIRGRTLTEDERLERIAELLEAARARGTGQPALRAVG